MECENRKKFISKIIIFILMISLLMPCIAQAQDETPIFNDNITAGNYLYNEIKKQNANIIFFYDAKKMDETKIVKQILEENTFKDDKGLGKLKDYYYQCVYKESKFSTKELEEYDGMIYRFRYRPQYTITVKQDKIIQKKLKTIAKKLKRKTKYKTIKAIYNYVIKRIKHYCSGQNNIYRGYYTRKGNCVIYSSLFYMLCRNLNTPCRMVYNKKHCWNLVKLNKKWYFCDACWDDNKKTQQFFLRGKKDFKLHRNMIKVPQKPIALRKFK